MRLAFLFEKAAEFPPGFNNIKSYYITQELVRRGAAVTWVQLNRKDAVSRAEGILFVGLGLPRVRLLSAVAGILRVLIYCILNEVELVYIDAWLYFRNSPFRQLVTVLALRIAGIRAIVDQRDPYLDFEMARGVVRPGTLKYRLLAADEKVMLFASSVLILPSKAYENLLLREGAPADRILGFFRGIDPNLFNPSVDGSEVRKRLGIQDKFVIGWFGMMHRHLLVKEVLIPLAGQIGNLVPNGYMLIGGKGPLLNDVILARQADPQAQFEYVGLIPYNELPQYLAACDLLLCPVSTDFRFSRHSNWLKILEGLAVGRPVVATKTEAASTDLGGLTGIVWTGQELADFSSAIKRAYQDRSHLVASALGQSAHLEAFSIRSTIPKIVDRISSLTK